MSTSMRAKFMVTNVKQYKDENGSTTGEYLQMSAVGGNKVQSAPYYPEDGSDEDNTFAKFTPCADLSISIANPVLFDQFKYGDKLYVDFSPAE